MDKDWTTMFPLVGAGGEKVDLHRTFRSHGVASLPPTRMDEESAVFETTFAVNGLGACTARVWQEGPDHGVISFPAEPPPDEGAGPLLATVRHILRMDEDLSGFYARAAEDPDLSWVTGGAGRMIRSPSVFEEVVKTICTTNCAWSATERMVGALIEHLGERAPGAPSAGPMGRAFPTPEEMARVGEDFYRDVVRAGYRGRYLSALARSVADGTLDLEELGSAGRAELPDDELEKRLLALPGVGPYAAAHVMMMLGRYSQLILDSWTRPKYAKLVDRPAVTDAEIKARFEPYEEYAGLAFWLYLTRDWIPDPARAR